MGVTTYDVMILDLSLPDGDGLDWLRKNRFRSTIPPILILTARDTLGERVAGLDLGADDFLTKPFKIEELAARLRALLRRRGSRTGTLIRIGDLSLEVASRTVRHNDQVLRLSRKETSLLEVLMQRAGNVVHRSSINAALYGFGDVTTPNAIDALVSRLRRKLELAGARTPLLTIHGIGYLLKDVER